MESPIVCGQKRSSLFFTKIDIYSDRIEIKGLLLPKKVIIRDEIMSWIEINKKHNSANLNWIEVTVFTNKTKYMISSLHWKNFNEMKQEMTRGKTRDTEKEKKTMLLISPRKNNSNWSKVNKAKIEKLIQIGRMHQSGLTAINRAKKNGSWNFLNDVDDLQVPDDLQKELQKHSQALVFFENFPPSSQRGILEWIKNAKTPATRQKRITETSIKAAINIKANHPEGRNKGPVLKG